MNFHITKVGLLNYGVFDEFSCESFSDINVLIGENGTGKTILLKALYSAIRTLEEFQREDDIQSVNEVLSSKLRGTFQVDKLSDLVNKSSTDNLSLKLHSDSNGLTYSFSKSARSKVGTAEIQGTGKEGNSIYLPAKEIFSLFSVIFKSREVDKVFGFDDTYYDLAKALRISPTRGRNYIAFANSRKLVGNIIDGKMEYDEQDGRWIYKNKKNQKFAIRTVSEGVKKVAILDRLLSNGYINKDSVIFIDEIESALHPVAICDFLDMIDMISRDMGIQFFISTHSYFVIKKLYLIAMKNSNRVTCISLRKDNAPKVYDLHEGMPENSIIDMSIQLYEQELEETL